MTHRRPLSATAATAAIPAAVAAVAAIASIAMLPQACTTKARPSSLYHDFGTLELGQSKRHDFDIPIPSTGAGGHVIPQSYRGNCACAVGMVMIEKADGRTKAVYGLPAAERQLEPGDRIILRLTLKTAGKEPQDIKRTEEFGHVGFRHVHGDNLRHSTVRIRFHYGLRSPIKCTPVTHVDFGELPMSNPPFTQTIRLRSNIPGQALKLGEPATSHDCITASLRPAPAATQLLQIAITPYSSTQTAPRIAGHVVMATGLEYYPNLVIQVSGSFIGDIQFESSFRINMDRFPFDKPKKQFVNIIDHNRSRPKGFVVHSFENTNGTDISQHFAVSFEPLSGRKTRVWVNYLGTMGGKSLRAWLSLSKRKGEEPVARIHIIGHNRNVKIQ